MTTRGTTEPIGLAILGCGSIGRIRAVLASEYPAVGWIGLCDVDEGRAKQLAEDVGAEFYTTDAETLLARPEVNAVIVATSEVSHVQPTLAAVELGYPMLIEKPLATDVVESKRVLDAIQAKGIDAVMGYTQRFRRRYITIHERLQAGVVGEIDSVITRGLLNRGVEPGINRLAPEDRKGWSQMTVNGTHTVDLAMWFLGDKKPAELYSRTADRVLGHHGITNTTVGVVTMEDGTIWSMAMSLGMPFSWPAIVYGLDIVIIGAEGAITVDDTHRDVVVATSEPQPWRMRQAGSSNAGLPYERRVEFLTSYPPGDQAYGQTWGPMREETNSWFARITLGTGTPHATAEEGHRNAILTAAFDVSAKQGKAITWPVDLEELSKALD